ncbi:two-component system response regulator CreB [Mesoterricola silvestris]|uniref:DNA-binding response regulator n=1 Tax=Mesoterricola silvestris TaxID=2927979 RepID=A0AA48GTF3_9BACT|nr:two-component system response regulator CreB [Mesoterricola silvestris]BDU73712.1 DNA-binding response regulator [Mesoterricola silvestris]
MPGRILIVEDERAIADTLIYALRTEGFEPVWCDLGGKGIEAVRASEPALVILDVGLPDLSGFEVCRSLRTFSEVPILFLTARGDEVDRIVGLEIGADDYVTKPFSPREVAARVRTILRRTRPVSTPKGFQVEGAARRIAYGGRLLDLTRFEHDLLRTLLAHPGRIFTRVELMESVWAGSEDSQDRTVDTHIKTLRAKIRAVAPEADPIQTHRGVGYSVDPA